MDDIGSCNTYVYVFDRRRNGKNTPEKIYIDESFSYSDFEEEVCTKFEVETEDFVICTTGRNALKDENFEKLIQSGDSVYVLETIDQPLETSVSEKIEFQPHYDTLIKSGMYEYYASEGHANPLPFAFAELIDNALAATRNNEGQRRIELSIHFDETSNNHCVCVYDNGKGMTSRQLNNWAIYRLSKFNRQERDAPSEGSGFHEQRQKTVSSMQSGDRTKLRSDAESIETPKSLNSDISWFGVGGKQAVFFIGSSTRVITKTQHSCDVHEFTMSMADFIRKEMKKEAIFSGYIRNRKTTDTSHIENWERVTKDFVQSERDDESFTRIIVTDIKPEHLAYMRAGFDGWTKQLAHIYHYYIHGPEGNTIMSRMRKNVGALDVQIYVNMYEQGKLRKTVELGKIDDDLESRYIRSASDNFEFVYYGSDRSSKCEGVIRYHPFLYDRETNPTLSVEAGEMDDDASPAPLIRNTRSLIECYWNGRLIPYTFIEGFEWCKPSKRVLDIPPECYMRVTGCLFTNDKFQVSTNKLTFIDLDTRLRDSKGVFYRTILGQTQRTPSIQRSFQEWLHECHNKYDKQIKFLQYKKNKTIKAGNGKRIPGVYSVYGAIEWDGRIFKEGEMIRTQRTNPIITGSIKSFLLYGDLKGDEYAVGGEVELIQEPAKIYGGIKTYPIAKIDRTMDAAEVKKIVSEEENRLPSRIRVEWPEGNEIVDGFIASTQVAIGAMKLTILNKRNEALDKLPAAAGSGNRRRLHMKQQLFYIDPITNKKSSIISHTTPHGKTWPYWFKRIDAAKDSGDYEIHLQVVLAESGSEFLQNEKLPLHIIKFSIETSDIPVKFAIGVLESSLRIGSPFDIPLTIQNENNGTCRVRPAYKCRPHISANDLKMSFQKVSNEGHQIVIKGVVADGEVSGLQGKDFTVTVKLKELKAEQKIRIRLFPGPPFKLGLAKFNKTELDYKATEIKTLRVENGSEMKLTVVCLDMSGNITCEDKLAAVCKLSGIPGLPSLSCDLSQSGRGVLCERLHLRKSSKKHKKEEKQRSYQIKAVVKVHDRKVYGLEFDLLLEPSTQIQSLEVFYPDISNENKSLKIKKGQDIFCQAGGNLTGLSFVIYDEARRPVTIDKTCAARMKVNWVGESAQDLYEKGQLPDCGVPTAVTETKFCQVSLTGSNKSISVSFNLRPIAGEPASMKVSHIIKEVRLGEPTVHPIYINLTDSYGNILEAGPQHLSFIKVYGESLDDTKVITAIQDSTIAVTNLQFNEGPPGNRVITVKYNDTIEECCILPLCPGTPVTLSIVDWEETPENPNFVQILSGCRMTEPIRVQLFDGWGNKTNLKGVYVKLGKDPGIRLSPATSGVKTNEEGIATFPLFTVTARCGTYYIQPKATYERATIEGPKLSFAVMPNNEKPAKLQISPHEDLSLQTGSLSLPDFTVDVLSEEGENVTSEAFVCMTIWRGGAAKEVPPHAEWNRSYTEGGRVVFTGVSPPKVASNYSIAFCVVSSKTSRTPLIISDRTTLAITPGPPSRLEPEEDPGTPTVSNSKNSSDRTIIKSMRLRLKDQHGNNTYFTNEDGSRRTGHIEVSIQPSKTNLKTDTSPQFESMTSSLRLPMSVEGIANIQNVVLGENSPGSDGSEYILHCEVSSPEKTNVAPYMLKFFFYNDAKKQAEISNLIKKRDELRKACNIYKQTFSTSEALNKEYNTLCSEYRRKKRMIVEEMKWREHPSKNNVFSQIDECRRKLSAIGSQSLRECKVKDYNESEDVLGKICHLAKVEDENVAKLLSWHLSADMDCVVTRTTKKAQELNKLFKGMQQLLPLDSIRKRKDDWSKPLPRINRAASSVRGNPRYARNLLVIEKNVEECRNVFKMLLGDTIVMDNLDSANAYRKMVIEYSACPAILTLDGSRVRSTGKFGGKQNICPSIQRLHAVFGAPQPKEITAENNKIDQLEEYLTLMKSEEDTMSQIAQLQNDEEMRQKRKEHRETERKLREMESEIANRSRSLSSTISVESTPTSTNGGDSFQHGHKRSSIDNSNDYDPLRSSPRKKKKRGGL